MKILTINLKAHDSIATLKERILPIIDMVRRRSIDVILIQEAPGGIVSLFQGNCFNSVKHIANQLGYDYADCRMTGWPLLYTVRLGIIAGDRIDELSVRKILNRPMIDFNNFKFDEKHLFPWTRKILGAKIGQTAFFCTHLGYELGNPGFTTQAKNVASYIRNAVRAWGTFESVIGGDFNFDGYSKTLNPFYATMISGGYVDAQFGEPDIKTFGVEGNPYGSGLINRPYRIDYIMTRNMRVLHAETVFNQPGTFVSDHCGVYVEVEKSEASR